MRRRFFTPWVAPDLAGRVVDLTRARDDLAAERDDLKRELARVTAQRDELRRVIADVRRVAREEAAAHARETANQVMGDALAASTATMNEEMGQPLQEPSMPNATGEPVATPTPSGPIHMAAHLADPADPAHTGR